MGTEYLDGFRESQHRVREMLAEINYSYTGKLWLDGINMKSVDAINDGDNSRRKLKEALARKNELTKQVKNLTQNKHRDRATKKLLAAQQQLRDASQRVDIEAAEMDANVKMAESSFRQGVWRAF